MAGISLQRSFTEFKGEKFHLHNYPLKCYIYDSFKACGLHQKIEKCLMVREDHEEIIKLCGNLSLNYTELFNLANKKYSEQKPQTNDDFKPSKITNTNQMKLNRIVVGSTEKQEITRSINIETQEQIIIQKQPPNDSYESSNQDLDSYGQSTQKISPKNPPNLTTEADNRNQSALDLFNNERERPNIQVEEEVKVQNNTTDKSIYRSLDDLQSMIDMTEMNTIQTEDRQYSQASKVHVRVSHNNKRYSNRSEIETGSITLNNYQRRSSQDSSTSNNGKQLKNGFRLF